MRLIRKTLPLNHNLFLFGDDHEGMSNRHDEGWTMLVKMMKSKYEGCKENFGVDHGDIIEAIPCTDPRYDRSSEKSNYLNQIDQAIENRELIRAKLVCILDGNHPYKYVEFGNSTDKVCEKLGVPYGTHMTHITYETTKGNVMYRHYAYHGWRTMRSGADDPIRRDANLKLSLKRQLKDKFADCALMTLGHTHKLVIVEPTKSLYLTGGDDIKQHYTGSHQADSYIHPDHRWYVNTGSFMKLYGHGYSTYAERFGYDPMELGFAIVRVRDGIIQGIDKIVLETPKEETSK